MFFFGIKFQIWQKSEGNLLKSYKLIFNKISPCVEDIDLERLERDVGAHLNILPKMRTNSGWKNFLLKVFSVNYFKPPDTLTKLSHYDDIF